jgi:arylsulfatase A
MMTGKSLMRFGTPPREMPFIPQFLRNAGYRTGIAGKWMMGPLYSPDIKGFDEACIYCGHYEFWDPMVMVFNSGGYLKELNQPSTLDKVRGGDFYTKCEVEDAYAEGCRTILKGQFGPDVINRFACDFITRNASEPFFLYYPLKLVHVPYPQLPGGSETGGYASAINYMDTLVGKIVATLEEQGIRDNTLILFAGDNGHHCRKVDEESVPQGQTCLPGKKGGTKEGATRVPFIANWKTGGASGVVCEDLVDILDILPTFAAAGGARLPSGEVFDGRSILPRIQGQASNPREWLYIHGGYHPNPLSSELEQHYPNGLPDKIRYAFTHDYKLYNDGRFYDLKNDREESTVIELDTGSAEAEEARRLLQGVLNYYDDRSQWHDDKDSVEPTLYDKAEVGKVRTVGRRISPAHRIAAPDRSGVFDLFGRAIRSPGTTRGVQIHRTPGGNRISFRNRHQSFGGEK